MGLLLFNWVGYRLLVYCMEEKASLTLEARLDENKYDASELISLKVPVTNLAYYHNSKEFECVAGRIEIGGVEYKYVKRRIYNDSLEVMCIPDHAATRLKLVNNEFFRFANGLQHTGQGKKQDAAHHTVRYFSPDFCQQHAHFDLHPGCIGLAQKSSFVFSPICSLYTSVAGQPPELSC